MSNFDKIEEFEQFTFKQWIALGTVLGGLDVVKGVMRGTMKVTVETIHRLTALINFTLPASGRKVHDFFQTRKGLRVSGDFNKLILTAAQKDRFDSDNMTLGHSDLAEAANDYEIRAELPEGHVFTDVNVFLVLLIVLIEAQWLNEGKGPLINTGYANIFYLEIAGTVFTVDVHWDSGGGEWNCFAYRTDARRWFAGDRAFSATGALTT